MKKYKFKLAGLIFLLFIAVMGQAQTNVSVEIFQPGVESCYAAAVDQVKILKNFTVFPNPATDVINVEWADRFVKGEVTIHVYNQLGKTVRTFTVEANGHLLKQVDVSDFTKGTYFIRVTCRQLTDVRTAIIE